MRVRKLLYVMWVLFIFLFGSTVATAYAEGADPLDNWVPRTFDVHLTGICYGNNTYVTVGGRRDNFGGAALVSSDGAGNEWAQVTPGPDKLNAVAFGKGVFVGVASGGAIYHSTDGKGWVLANSNTTLDLKGVAYGNNIFVAAGGETIGEQIILTSVDGVNWTRVTSVTPLSEQYNVSFINNKFFILGWGGQIYYSADGNTWNKTGAQVASLYGSAYGNGRWVVVGTSGGIATSTTLKKWSSVTAPTMEDLYGIAFNGTVFVAVGAKGNILTSTDGLLWSVSNFTTPGHFRNITVVNGSFVAVGDYGLIAVSADGTTWTTKVPGTTFGFYDVVFANNTFVAVGERGSIVTSPDGMNWTLRLLLSPPGSGLSAPLFGVAYGKGMFVVVGGSGEIYTSSDNGITWTAHATPVSQLYGVAFGNDTFVAVGYAGAIARSSDGINWTQIPTNFVTLDKVMFNGTEFIAVGDKARQDSRFLVTSPDGVTWTQRIFNSVPGFSGAAFANGASILSAIDGSIVTSSGTANWTWRDTHTTAALMDVGSGNNTFISVGLGGTIFTSYDGRSGWLLRNSGTTNRLYSVAYGNNRFVAVGTGVEDYTAYDTATILQSGVVIPLNSPPPVPEAKLDKMNLDFGGVKRGNSFTQQLTVTNIWTGVLDLTSMAITGTNADEFVISGNTCGSTMSVSPDQSCTIEVTFTPSGPFERVAIFTLATNDPGRPIIEIPLKGIGLQPIIDLSPASLNFAPVPVGYRTWQMISLSNKGNDILTETMSLTGPNAGDFAITGACTPNGNLSATDFCWINVMFAPTSAGFESASIEIRSNDPDVPYLIVPLSGTGY